MISLCGGNLRGSTMDTWKLSRTLMIYSYTSSRVFFRYFRWVRFLHRRLSLSELQRVWGSSPLQYMSTPYDRVRCGHVLYLIGIEFELDMDHKQLEVIYSPKTKPSAPIDRWILRLQACSNISLNYDVNRGKRIKLTYHVANLCLLLKETALQAGC